MIDAIYGLARDGEWNPAVTALRYAMGLGDGPYDETMRDRVRAIQKANNLEPVDGILDDMTVSLVAEVTRMQDRSMLGL